MSRRHNEAEYHLLSEHKLNELKRQIVEEYTRKCADLVTWRDDELERVEEDYKNMHAIGLERYL
jgi:hypothetical protein